MRSNYLALLVPVLTLQLDLISALPTPEDAALVERAASCPAGRHGMDLALEKDVALMGARRQVLLEHPPSATRGESRLGLL